MKLHKRSGKGMTPKTAKQADQFAYYDTILTAYKQANLDVLPFSKINASFIELVAKRLTGKVRGVPLEDWLAAIERIKALGIEPHTRALLIYELKKTHNK